MLAGGFGVEVFFVLSSYLITTLLLREADAARTGSTCLPFWLRRVLRIWPLYLGVLFAYALLVGVPTRLLVAFALFAGNWGMAAWPGMPTSLYPLWSVSVEEQFYLAWPLILSAVPRRRLRMTACGSDRGRRRHARRVVRLGRVNVSAVWMNTAAHLDAIGVGALVALGGHEYAWCPAARRALAAASVLRPGRLRGAWCGTPCSSRRRLAPRCMPEPAPRRGRRWRSSARRWRVAGCWSPPSPPRARGYRTRRSMYLGRISYGLYVYHGLALAITDSWVWPVASAFAADARGRRGVVPRIRAAVPAAQAPIRACLARIRLGHTAVSAGVRVP